MTRRSSRSRMALRGRAGLLAYLLLGTVGFLAVYYLWTNYFSSSSSKIQYSRVESVQGDNFDGFGNPKVFAMEKPPVGLDAEISIEMQGEEWRKHKALQDRIDEEMLARNMPAPDVQQQLTYDVVNGSKVSPWKPNDRRENTALIYEAKAEEKEYFSKLERLVHLDLKGAPPKVSYLEKLFPVLKKLGATGLLIEYEDMFPYSGNLSIVAAANAYRPYDIERIRAAATANGLQIVPLVQTFGHMEFVLKHDKFKHLRESSYTPQVISPIGQESYTLLYDILEQIIRAHPDSTRIHLGCDEVYELGKGKTAEYMTSNRLTASEVFLHHVSKVAGYIKRTYPSFQPLIWDDQLRRIDYDILQNSRIQEYIEPVVWYYGHDVLDRIPASVWDIYGKTFPGVWVASAFKGATGASQMLTDASFHLDNSLQWMSVMGSFGFSKKVVKFRGVMLTGWQRYDHFATLCELLPVAVPSLALNLQAFRVGGFTPGDNTVARRILNCSSELQLEYPKLNKDGADVSQDCRFPGSHVYYAVQQLWGILENFKNDKGLQSRISGWMTPYQVRQGISSPGQMKITAHKLAKVLNKLHAMRNPLRDALEFVYDKSTVDEWLMVNVKDRYEEFDDLFKKANNFLKRSSWPVRPFTNVESTGSPAQAPIGNKASGVIRVYPAQPQDPNRQQQRYSAVGTGQNLGNMQPSGQSNMGGTQNLGGRQQNYGRVSNVGPGQANLGGGQPNVGPGQANLGGGGGKPNVGLGQANLGGGQPNVGLGQANLGGGQPNVGLGQANLGGGQPNVGLGQANLGGGQPNVAGTQTFGGYQQSLGNVRLQSLKAQFPTGQQGSANAIGQQGSANYNAVGGGGLQNPSNVFNQGVGYRAAAQQGMSQTGGNPGNVGGGGGGRPLSQSLLNAGQSGPKTVQDNLPGGALQYPQQKPLSFGAIQNSQVGGQNVGGLPSQNVLGDRSQKTYARSQGSLGQNMKEMRQVAPTGNKPDLGLQKPSRSQQQVSDLGQQGDSLQNKMNLPNNQNPLPNAVSSEKSPDQQQNPRNYRAGQVHKEPDPGTLSSQEKEIYQNVDEKQDNDYREEENYDDADGGEVP